MKMSCGGRLGRVNLNQILENNFVREQSLLGGPVGDGTRQQGACAWAAKHSPHIKSLGEKQNITGVDSLCSCGEARMPGIK